MKKTVKTTKKAEEHHNPTPPHKAANWSKAKEKTMKPHWWEDEEAHKHTRTQAEGFGESKKKSTKINKEELSSKNRHGHFSKMHVWPVMLENKKGQKV